MFLNLFLLNVAVFHFRKFKKVANFGRHVFMRSLEASKSLLHILTVGKVIFFPMSLKNMELGFNNECIYVLRLKWQIMRTTFQRV